MASVPALIDRVLGTIEGEQIIRAYQTLAFGNEAAIEAFFGTPVRLRAKERLIALRRLEDRRFGRLPIVEDVNPAKPSRTVLIQNVYLHAPEYDHVRNPQPRRVGGSVSTGAARAGGGASRVLGDEMQ